VPTLAVKETTMRVTPEEKALILAVRRCPLGPAVILGAAAARFIERANEKENESPDVIDRVVIEQARRTAEVLQEASDSLITSKQGAHGKGES